MKVRVPIMVDIDPVAWTLNYGVEGAAAVRADVTEYVQNVVREHLRDLGLLMEES